MEKAARYKALRTSLFFAEHQARHEQVPEAYKTTFGWIFDANKSALGAWDNFADWLRKGNGIYWIHGKPGAGESTLMSYILEQD